MPEPDLDDLKRRMRGAIDVLHSELTGLRTGRASAGLLEPLTVEAYGSSMPMNQVATIHLRMRKPKPDEPKATD